MIAKTRAIVIRMIPFSETSRIVTWLTADYGKTSTMIKGSQRRNSQFLGQFDFFYTCELLFYLRTYQGLHIVKECSPLRSRGGFRTNWKSTACASYVSDLVFNICPVHAPHPEIFLWLESALDFFAGQTPMRVCLFWYELRLMEVMGLSPQFSVCLKCRRPLMNTASPGADLPAAGKQRSSRPVHSCASEAAVQPRKSTDRSADRPRHFLFSSSQGGVYCRKCSTSPAPDTVEIHPDILGLLRFWQASRTWHAAQRSKCTDHQLEEVEKIIGLLLQYHFGINITSRSIALDVLQRQTPANVIP